MLCGIGGYIMGIVLIGWLMVIDVQILFEVF